MTNAYATAIEAALEALARGYQIVPIRPGLKGPRLGEWQKIRWEPGTTREQLVERLTEWGFAPDEPFNIGIILGPASGNLVDVDIDHHLARRFRQLLPRTFARSGRPGSIDSHFWYIADDDPSGLPTPSTRQYKLKDRETVSVEFRYDLGVQTVIPPSDWVPKDWVRLGSKPQFVEIREWGMHGPWGGDRGPAHVSGRKLALQVALIGLAAVLLEDWPKSGTRHQAYLALAGALLRQADGVVHPFWASQAEVLIGAIADATLDDDGRDTRIAETIPSTIDGIRNGKLIWGFPKLAELLSDDAVTQARVWIAEIESLAGFQSRNASGPPVAPPTPPAPPSGALPASGAASTPGDTPAPETGAQPAETEAEGSSRNPVEKTDEEKRLEESGTWNAYDLEPYLNGQYTPVEPTILKRDDGRHLIYPGRLNMFFAPSEAGKTLLALYTGLEVMHAGERVVFLDFEDEPTNTIERLRSMGATDDMLRFNFSYVRPEGPIATMQRDTWGNHKATPLGERNAELFAQLLEKIDPTLIIADGMTSIYGLHGLDSNNSVETDVITTWLKSLSRNERTTVIIIDHMSKASGKGSLPIGSQHKTAMVQGTLLQVWPVVRPVKGQADGEVELYVLKDRPGEVRRYSGKMSDRAQLAATVLIDSSKNNGATTEFKILAPVIGGSGPTVSQTAKARLNAQAKRDAAADAKRARRKLAEGIMLGPFGGVLGTTLPARAFNAPEIKKAWFLDNKFSQTAWETIRADLIDSGILEKAGGVAGPAVTYTLRKLPAPPIG